LGTWTGIWRHEGHTTTLQGYILEPYSVFDTNVQRELINGFTGFVSIENVGDVKYQVSQTAPTATALSVMQQGMPRTVRFGVMFER